MKRLAKDKQLAYLTRSSAVKKKYETMTLAWAQISIFWGVILLANIRLKWKGWPRANTLAYLPLSSAAKKKVLKRWPQPEFKFAIFLKGEQEQSVPTVSNHPSHSTMFFVPKFTQPLSIGGLTETCLNGFSFSLSLNYPLIEKFKQLWKDLKKIALRYNWDLVHNTSFSLNSQMGSIS